MDVLIGVAWPYASGPRHLGHLAGAYLPADVAARHHRLAGDRVLLVSGSDQHGTPITVAAERAGLSPAALADREHERIAASFARAGISFDHYTRTATPRHHAVTQDLFTRLHRRGLVAEATQPAAFCAREGRSLPDRYVEGTCPSCGAPDARGDQCDTCGRTLDPEELGEPRCRRCGGPAELRPLRQLFLRLDLLQPEVARYLDGHEARWRPFVGAEARGWLAVGPAPEGDHPRPGLGRARPAARLGRPPAVRLVRRRHRLPVGLGGVGRAHRRPRRLAAVVAGPRGPAPLLRRQGQHLVPHRLVAGHPARRRPRAAPARRGGRQPPPDPAHRGTSRGRREAVGQPGACPHDRGGHRAGRPRPAAPRPGARSGRRRPTWSWPGTRWPS